MEKLTLVNGNKREYQIGLPKLIILEKFNDVAKAHILENTGLWFTDTHWQGMEAQPIKSEQIAALFMTYNFKTQYHNNNTNENTLFLKPDHHQGFHVDSICYECCKANHININGLEPGDRLAC